MGANIFSLTTMTIVVLAAIDAFDVWYCRFLAGRMADGKMRRRTRQAMWALLALIFWSNFHSRGFAETFNISYFLFFFSIYTLRGLVISLFSKE